MTDNEMREFNKEVDPLVDLAENREDTFENNLDHCVKIEYQTKLGNTEYTEWISSIRDPACGDGKNLGQPNCLCYKSGFTGARECGCRTDEEKKSILEAGSGETC